MKWKVMTVAPGSKAGRGLKLLRLPFFEVKILSSARLQSRARIETLNTLIILSNIISSARLQSRARIETS